MELGTVIKSTSKVNVIKARKKTYQIVKAEYCYKEYKFLSKEIPNGDCPWGYKKFMPELCSNCRWCGEKILETKEVEK